MVLLRFENITDGKYLLSVYDGVGKVVRTSNLNVGGNRAIADLSRLAKGVYLLYVADGKNNWSVKVVLQ